MAFAEAKLPVTQLLGSLSLATDLGTGQPLGHGLSTSLLAVQVAQELGCDDAQIRRVQQVSLIRFLGCTSDSNDTARMSGGDDLSFMKQFAPAHMGNKGEATRAMIRAVGSGQPAPRRLRLIGAALTNPASDAGGLAAHCEVGAMLARRLGLDDDVAVALEHAYERWDGTGDPAGLEGEEIPLETRIAVVARDADLFARSGGAVVEILRERRGKAYDPRIVDLMTRLGVSGKEADWDEVLASEPEPVLMVQDIDHSLSVVADYVDLKSPWTRGHSRTVADLAEQAGQLLGMTDAQLRDLRRGALVHDLGRVGVENGIWDKPGPLATADWEKVRLHPYLTDRVLSRCTALAELGEIASSHHERTDGSGYHRKMTSDQLSKAGRVLAAADVMAALTADRPHRARFDVGEATRMLEAEAGAGRLDREAVAAVVSAAEGRSRLARPANPGSLTDREVEVLRLIARGHTNRVIGEDLYISPKTVGRHVENIYSKIGVSTRAAAALYAMEHRLLG